MAFGFPPRFHARRTIPVPPDELAEAVKLTFASLGWTCTSAADNKIQAQVPMTAWSWGEEFTANLLPGGVIQIESKCHGSRPQIIDYGKNRTNVQAFFTQLQHNIESGVHLKSASAKAPEVLPEGARPGSKENRAAAAFLGCCAVIFILTVLIFFVSAVIGLFTGYLYLPARGSGGVTLHGSWARITSTIILVFFSWVVIRVLRNRRAQISSSSSS